MFFRELRWCVLHLFYINERFCRQFFFKQFHPSQFQKKFKSSIHLEYIKKISLTFNSTALIFFSILKSTSRIQTHTGLYQQRMF